MQIVVAGALIADRALLVAQRRRPPDLAGLWELPGGKVAPGETEVTALARELREELGLEVVVGELSMQVSHEYPQYTVDLVVYKATTDDEPHKLRVHDLRWVLPEDFDQYEFPGADQRTVEELLK
jgi:8-oxo-dGTP diphosphatase